MPVPALTERNWSILSLLRFIMACSVMTAHAAFVTNVSHKWLYVIGGISPVFSFFMISGFSIAASIEAGPTHYLSRRIRRIYPLSITTILFTMGVIATLHYSGLLPPSDPAYKNLVCPPLSVVAQTMLLLNGLTIVTPKLFLPLWSLSCEMVYYLAAPVLRRLSTPIIALLALLSAASYLGYFLRPDSTVYLLALMDHGTTALLLAWLWLLGFLSYRHGGKWSLFFIPVLLGAFSLLYSPNLEGPLSVPLFMLAVFCIVNLHSIAMPSRMVGIANYLGELSYPIYVLHFPMMMVTGQILKNEPDIVIVAFIWVTTLALSAAAYHGIDRQFRYPRRVRAVTNI